MTTEIDLTTKEQLEWLKKKIMSIINFDFDKMSDDDIAFLYNYLTEGKNAE